jgi:hypothetical protein
MRKSKTVLRILSFRKKCENCGCRGPDDFSYLIVTKGLYSDGPVW